MRFYNATSLVNTNNGRKTYNIYLFLFYLGFYVTFNTIQVISRRVVGRAEETSAYSWSRFCTVNCRLTASNYQLSHLRPCREPNPSLRRGRRECYHSTTVAPLTILETNYKFEEITRVYLIFGQFLEFYCNFFEWKHPCLIGLY